MCNLRWIKPVLKFTKTPKYYVQAWLNIVSFAFQVFNKMIQMFAFRPASDRYRKAHKKTFTKQN